jgi:luciferase family oxidoreductase group 1
MTRYSILDLAPVTQEGTPSEALRNSLDLAQHAETWGYERFWLAEHHNMMGIASAATSVVIGYVAGGTSGIRVGAGGIMLPNHSPLVIAEQFGTLASLYPDRIDLGLGRAPGTDPLTSRALRRSLAGNVDDFPRDVVELQHYFQEPQPGQKVTAVPGATPRVQNALGRSWAACAGEEGLEILAHDVVEQRLLGLAALVLDGAGFAGPWDPIELPQLSCRRRNGSSGGTHRTEALSSTAPREGWPVELSLAS